MGGEQKLRQAGGPTPALPSVPSVPEFRHMRVMLSLPQMPSALPAGLVQQGEVLGTQGMLNHEGLGIQQLA